MGDEAASSYDEVPYSDGCFPTTHPDHLAAVATLHGLRPPPVATCRVLELGCALGGNLIPMAQGLPGARFVGIDLSARQVAAAREMAGALGLRNVEFHAISIADVGPESGEFDYVVCHGVYSWVPAAIREKILATCAANLAPGGVAYVSYNTYPGWHARGLVREMLNYHVRRRDGAGDRIREARGFLDDLLRVLPDREGSYARILKTEAEVLRGAGDHYLFHEHLEDTNQPCYFHEFAGRAAAHGLVAFSEAIDSEAERLSPEAAEALEGWADDPVARQQYLDFLCNRTFRSTLLCHASAGPAAEPDPGAVALLAIRAAARPVSERPDAVSDAVEEFRGDLGASLATAHPMVKTALLSLCEAWPWAVTLGALSERVESQLAEALGPDAEAVRAVPDLLPVALLRGFRSGLVGLHAHPPRFAPEPGERPVASPWARLQAAAGRERVANLRHRSVKLREFDRAVLGLLDGRHDRAALLDRLVAMVMEGDFTIEREGRSIRDEAEVRGLFAGEIEPSLRRLAMHALLRDDGEAR